MPLDPARPLLVLASASPRRVDLLQRAGIAHAMHPTNVDETRRPGEPAEDFAARVSQAKADAAAPAHPGVPVLAADTVVVTEEATLGKPPHEGAARQMLLLLSGRTHRVLTAYHLMVPAGSAWRRVAGIAETAVDVAPLSDDDIEAYLASDEWRGKAGGYAIQGRFACFVRGIRGNYENVVGLPLCQVVAALREAGVLPPEWPAWTP